MAKYRVNVLGVQGLNKKVYGPNETVEDKNFPAGVAELLAKSGHLVKIGGGDEKKIIEAKEALETAEREYLIAQEGVKELEKALEEADEGKKKKAESNLKEGKTFLTNTEKTLNKAKAALKKLQ